MPPRLAKRTYPAPIAALVPEVARIDTGLSESGLFGSVESREMTISALRNVRAKLPSSVSEARAISVSKPLPVIAPATR
ncbi:hypothetical protein D9M73_149370 [compost metagenome]